MMTRNEPAGGLGRVSGISPDPRHPTAVRISVEGRIVWTVPRARVDQLGVRVGQTVEEPLREVLLAAADEEGAWRALLRHLERRPFARRDLGRRLRQKAHPAPAVEAALERAAAAGLLDDLKYARSYAETRAPRGRGPGRLRRDLAQQGVAREVIDGVLAELWPDGEGTEEMARELTQKRARQLGKLPTPDRRRRLLAYLARRGFTGSQARKVVGEVVG
jgi:regulatory protein